MKKLIVATLVLACGASAQFGLGKLKSKIDQTRQRAAPVTDRAEKAVDTFTPWSEADEQEIGQAAAEKMVAMFGIVENPALNRYVNLVGYAVAQNASRTLPWQFGILDTDIVGAFALPGGYTFITRAALANMSNEAQLAGALGHEIEHTAARHVESEIRSKKTSAWAAQETLSKSSDARELARLRADAFLKDMFGMKLSRNKEDDADETGARLAALAGYSGLGLQEFLATLETLSKSKENARMFGQLLSTHPSFDDRIEKLKSLELAPGGATLEARFRKAIAAK